MTYSGIHSTGHSCCHARPNTVPKPTWCTKPTQHYKSRTRKSLVTHVDSPLHQLYSRAYTRQNQAPGYSGSKEYCRMKQDWVGKMVFAPNLSRMGSTSGFGSGSRLLDWWSSGRAEVFRLGCRSFYSECCRPFVLGNLTAFMVYHVVVLFHHVHRPCGADPTEQELGNLNGAGADPTEQELGNLNGAGADPTEQELGNLNGAGADSTEQELGNLNGAGADLTEQELGNLNGAGADPTEQELGNLNGAGADPTEQELGNLNGAGADPTEQELENLNGAGADPTEQELRNLNLGFCREDELGHKSWGFGREGELRHKSWGFGREGELKHKS
ncbi:hypothetical protein BHM03_00027502 [Ensete ventricosum]|nr:hypothetical protein BHM03_00027502 [Ensete ventricosum]